MTSLTTHSIITTPLLKTFNCVTPDAHAYITRNIFENCDIGFYTFNDDHRLLEVTCNRFKYDVYAIRSHSTLLNDFGTASVGAENEFTSASTYTNNRLYETNGTGQTYYYGPAHTMTTGMNIAQTEASTDRECYYYTFDTGSSARPYVDNIFENVFAGKTINLLPVPNPSNGKTTVYYNLGEGTSGELTLIDLQGRIIYQAKVGADKNNTSIDYASYQNGIYFLSLVTSRGDRITKKMILSK